MRSCAAWLAEFRPEPPRLSLPGLALAALMKSCEGLDRALLGHDQGVGRVVEPEHRRDVLRSCTAPAPSIGWNTMCGRLMPTMLSAVGGQLVHLRPHQRAARAGLVLDDGVDGRALLLQHHLLVARRQVRLAARRERLPVHDVLVGAAACAVRQRRERRPAQRQAESGRLHRHFIACRPVLACSCTRCRRNSASPAIGAHTASRHLRGRGLAAEVARCAARGRR